MSIEQRPIRSPRLTMRTIQMSLSEDKTDEEIEGKTDKEVFNRKM